MLDPVPHLLPWLLVLGGVVLALWVLELVVISRWRRPGRRRARGR